VIRVEGNDYNHLANSLRVRSGDELLIGDVCNEEFKGTVSGIDKKNVLIKISANYVRKMFSYPEVSLYFSLLKSDKNETVIQKCTELGVDRFIPVITGNSIVKPDESSCAKKNIKWKMVAREAAMQSGRRTLPVIFPIVKFENIKKYDIDSLKIFGFINEDSAPLASVLKGNRNKSKIDLFIGPEGDFTGEEIKTLQHEGWTGVSLGPNILRSETSAFFLVSSVMYGFQEGINEKI
jgi:16S rRNA (uracil1498-N3)-methyltransferase